MKKRTLRKEMMHALMSHGYMHDVAVKWLDEQDKKRKRKKRK